MRILEYYVFSNIHVAIAGFCLTKITLLKHGNSTNLAPFFVGLSILVSYNFIRFYEVKMEKVVWLKKWFNTVKRSLFFFSLLAVLGLLYIVIFSPFNIDSLKIIVPFAFMTFFYVIPMFKIGKKEISFRNFPGVKIFSIALAWAGISVLFPLFEQKINLSSLVWIEFLQRFLILIAIIIPFDIRDLKSDPVSLKTIPQLIGVKRAKMLGYLLLILFVLLEFVKLNPSKSTIYISIVIALITATFIKFSSIKRSRMYTGFWVEAIPIIWLGLIMLFL